VKKKKTNKENRKRENTETKEEFERPTAEQDFSRAKAFSVA